MHHDSLNNITVRFLLLLLVTGLTSCQNAEPVHDDLGSFIKQEPLVLVLKNRRDVYGEEVAKQVIQALDYTKFPYKTIDFGLLSEGLVIPPTTRVIVNTSFLLHELKQSDKDKIVDFVARGGYLVLAGTMAYDEFEYLQGMKYDADYTIDTNVTGFLLRGSVFPGSRKVGYEAPQSDPHSAFTRNNFRDDVSVYVTAYSDTTYPVFIGNKVGAGEVLTINSYSLDEKDYRGLIFSAILKGMSGVPYSVANVGTIFLDDFPAPLYNEKIEPIATEYGVEQAEFVTKIWWPDMQALADSFLIDYSAMTALNYNANVVPPFDFREWEAGKITIDGKEVHASIYLAQKIKESRHELAFHGYNHFSLWKSDWDNINFMLASLQASRKRWRVDDLGRLPVTYVPPTNFIDSVGIQALTKGMPSIKVMSSLYLGITEDGGNREFGWDPYSDKLFNYPRITSGFSMQDKNIFNQHGMQLLTGIWNHFIHPDDVFQITQRTGDSFESRNPLGLGWRTSQNHDYGLYDVFIERLKTTKKLYPFIRFLSAEQGAGVAQDWRTKLARYKSNQSYYTIETAFPINYRLKEPISNQHHWFMYVPDSYAEQLSDHLDSEVDGFAYSRIWNGYLFQFYTSKNTFTVPNLTPALNYTEEQLDQIAADVFREYRSYQDQTDDILVSFDNPNIRIQEALDAYRLNPESVAAQDTVIKLAVEFQRVQLAIDILEKRILGDPKWSLQDQDRLITYYGWENVSDQAIQFLETLWDVYGNNRVISFKNEALSRLDIYSPAFAQKWLKREADLNPDDEAIQLSYLKSIESEETWSQIKPELLRLIGNNPDTDSLYFYTLQRSFYYDSTQTTIELLEDFPVSAHPQLVPLSAGIALAYGYEIVDYDKALYWADKSDGITEQTKLEWIAQQKDFDRFYRKATSLLASEDDGDSLRVYAGTTLFYNGYKDQGYEILYPLFEVQPEGNTEAHRLIDQELRYMSIEDRTDLYTRYPAFFNDTQKQRLASDIRWNRGTRGSLFGEYYTDNFDNNRGRGGVSVQVGYRRDQTHLFKVEDIYTSNRIGTTVSNSNFSGLSYEFEDRSLDYKWDFKTGAGIFGGNNGLIGEIYTSLSYSYDSTFTSGKLALQPVLTKTGIDNNYYKTQLEIYREDFWLKDQIVTSLSGVGRYYTNSVFDYEAIGRVYIQPVNKGLRLRGIAEISWADASESFLSGVPFYTPDNWFVKGIGLDLRYRKPDNFDYLSLLEIEVMGKHEQSDGFYVTGRASLEKKLSSFWEFKAGTEFSTSRIYRSNRVFFTLSHYFNHSIK